MKVYSTWNPRPVHVCENSGEDIVIPDDSLSVIEIISRFQRGLPTDIHERPMMYDDDDSNFEYPENMDVDPMNEFNDLSDVYDMSEELVSKTQESETQTEKIDPTRDSEISSDSNNVKEQSTPNS